MVEPYRYDAIIIILAADLLRVKNLLPLMYEGLPVDRLVFVGNEEVGKIVAEEKRIPISFLDERSILPFEDVERILKERLNVDAVPRKIVGWYYQQFLKLGYAQKCENKYYLVWDGDTVPCGKISMFKEGTAIPYLDTKHEYNEEYFITMSKLFPGYHKAIEASFISEHMLFDKDIVNEMLGKMMMSENLSGESFYERILRSIRKESLLTSSFSEYETYGTYVAFEHTAQYALRNWHSIRWGSALFEPDKMTHEDFEWIGKDFDAISFEEDEEFLPEYSALFYNPQYREKLSARQIFEAFQDIALEYANVREKW